MSSKKSIAAEEILISLQETPDRLIQVGSRQVVDRLAELARAHVALCAEDDAVLARHGFDEEWRALIQPQIDRVESSKRQRLAAAAEARPAGEELEALLKQANGWLSDYRLIIENSGPSIREKAPKADSKARTREAIAALLLNLSDFIERHAAATQRAGGGKSFAEAGKHLSEMIRKKRTAHGKKRGKVPLTVKELHQVAGLVYLEMVRLSKVARRKLPAVRASQYAMAEGHGSRKARSDSKKEETPPKKSGSGSKKGDSGSKKGNTGSKKGDAPPPDGTKPGEPPPSDG